MRAMLVGVVLWAGSALAYPWMVKQGFASCAACHVDPSGAGQLTTFGRVQSEQTVRWVPPGSSPHLNNSYFLWFADLPSDLNLSGNLRFGGLVQPGANPAGRGLEMAFDLSATYSIGDAVLLHADVGFGRGDAVSPVVVAPACDPAAPGECGPSLLMRSFWGGFKAADGAVLVRGGRLVVPFGLRNAEHVAWVRTLTRTDFNVHQQLGAAVAVQSGALRTEVMGLAGSWQPGTQEGGYSGYAEYTFHHSTFGLSSLVSRGWVDGSTRHAHGAFARVSFGEAVVLLAEADALAWLGPTAAPRVGYAAFLQADWEVTKGLHLMLTGESAHQGYTQRGPGWGAWASLAWYFFSHCELRVDNLLRRPDDPTGLSYTLVVQLHAFL